MRTNRGITIGVLCEGKMAEEYGHQNEDECAVSCFIPGESDQTFEIFVSNELTKQDVAISIRIDGTFIGRYFLGLGQNILPGLYVSECVTKPFRFRALDVQDEQTLRDPQCWRWETMGLMEFSVYRCIKKSREKFRSTYVPSIPDDASTAHSSATRSPSPDAEQTSRPGSERTERTREREDRHSISTGPERSIPPIEGVQGVTLDPPDQPFARLIFRYRPRTALQVQGVIPTAVPFPPGPSRRPSVQPPIAPVLSTPSPSTLPPASRPPILPPLSQISPMPPPTATASQWAVEEVRRGWAPAPAEPLHRDAQPRRTAPLEPQRFAPYPRPGSSHNRIPSRAHSLPERIATAATTVRVPDNTAEELTSIKTQMAHVCDRMQNAMQQIKRCAETVEEAMGQLRFLQRQLDILEVRQRQLPPPAPPTEPVAVVRSVKADPVAQEAMPHRRPAAIPRSPQLQWPA